MKLARTAVAAALAAASLFAVLPAHAVGSLIDVNVIERDSGRQLPVYHHDGEYWVAGRPGARYAIQVRNMSGERVMGVMSVDGVNVITGDTASWEQSGYVLSRYQNAQITGWRKSEAEVAAFHFTALPRSYAARTGRPDNVGVIGVAVFREQYRRPVYPLPRRPGYPPSINEGPAARSESGAMTEAYPDGEARDSVQSQKSAPVGPRLGTGHGERETAYSSNTRFDRASSQPDEVISIRYDSRDNLAAMGIIPARGRYVPQRPDAFPQAPDERYVPDPPHPPRWR